MARAVLNRPLRSRKSPERIGLWSRRKWGQLDKRLAESKQERAIIEALCEQIGGNPTAAEQIVIAQTARVAIMATLLTKRIIESGDLGDLQARQTLALVNTTRLGLQALGLERRGEPAPDLVRYIGGSKGGKAA